MYIKLQFKFILWEVPHCNAGLIASLTKEPEIVLNLPLDAKADAYGRPVKDLLGTQIVQSDYFLNCGSLNQKKIEKALQSFQQHYDDYKKGLPAAEVKDPVSRANIIIDNLRIAVNNVLEPEATQPFLSDEAENLDDLIELVYG